MPNVTEFRLTTFLAVVGSKAYTSVGRLLLQTSLFGHNRLPARARTDYNRTIYLYPLTFPSQIYGFYIQNT